MRPFISIINSQQKLPPVYFNELMPNIYIAPFLFIFITYMSRWGNNKDQEEETVNFEALLSDNINAVALMETEHFLEKVKNNSANFTQIIILPSHRSTLYEIIDIALNPNLYRDRNKCPVNTTLTHCAIQVLTSLSEEFMHCVFEENGKKEDDEVIQSTATPPILEYIFGVVLSKQAEETGFAYLVKLVTPFLYQRPQKMLLMLNGDIMKGLMHYFGSNSVCELLEKALEAEGEDNQFYQPLKLSLVKVICETIGQQQNPNRLLALVQNFAEFLEGLVDKHEDKYQKQKYSSLIRNIVASAQNFQFLITALSKYPQDHVLKGELLHCLQAYLRIHLPIRQKQKQNSKASNESNTQINKAIKVNQNFIHCLKDCLLKLGLEPFVSEERLELLCYYKLIKILITVEPELIGPIFTKDFMSETLKIMQKDPDNNVLHNYQKDVLIEGVHKSPQVYLLLKNQIGFQSILRDNLTNALCKNSYESQLFLIGEAVKNKTEELQAFTENWNDLETIIRDKRNFYSTVIGGGPRSFSQGKWDDFEGEDVKEQVIQTYNGNQLFSGLEAKPAVSFTPKLDSLGGTQVLSEEGDKNEEQEQKNEHYFDFELPFDSDKDEDKEAPKELQNQKVNINPSSAVQIALDPHAQSIEHKQDELPPPPSLPDGDKLISSEQQKPEQIKKVQVNRKVTFSQPQLTQQQSKTSPNSKFTKVKDKQSLVEILFGQAFSSQNCEEENRADEDSEDKIGMLKGSMVDSQLWLTKGDQQPQKLIEFMEFITETPSEDSGEINKNPGEGQTVCKNE